jgi:hypothetical protein
MQQPLQPIIQHLFQVPNLEDVSRERLESFVTEYPSFGIGHYLLSHKLRTEDPGLYEETTQKTCLYFSNPFWLQWLLENSGSRNGMGEGTAVRETGWAETPAGEVLEDEMTRDAVEEETPVEVQIEETPVEAVMEETPEMPAAAEAEAPVESPVIGSSAEQLLRSVEEAKGLRESLRKIDEDFETPFVLDEPEEATSIAEPTSPEEAASAVVPMLPEPAPAEATVPEPPMAVAEPAPSEPALVFEPYHTIDYFASQGIRLTLDEAPADNLGKQLKSFTEWLKMMRRLPQKDRETVPDRVAEQAVQSFAAHSIEGKEVLTETMADVLAKQGMRDRARAVYEKLSLLNPDKSAYFAAKIEQLNIP